MGTHKNMCHLFITYNNPQSALILQIRKLRYREIWVFVHVAELENNAEFKSNLLTSVKG